MKGRREDLSSKAVMQSRDLKMSEQAREVEISGNAPGQCEADATISVTNSAFNEELG